MALPTLTKIWGTGTSNKYTLTDEMVNTGIALKSDVVSNQLNSVANRTDIFIDNLQRVTAWNAGKTYNIGDMVEILVNFQTPKQLQKLYKITLVSTIENNTNEPLQKSVATIFQRNDDYAIPVYTIATSSEALYLKNFLNNGWNYAYHSDLTELAVKFETQELVAGKATFNGDVVINGEFTSNDATYFNEGVTLNALGYGTTPPADANGQELVTAEWVINMFENG